jgi:Secretion system C-terminal sorting domain
MKLKSCIAAAFTVAFLANTATAFALNLTPTEKVGIQTVQKDLVLKLTDTELQKVTISIETAGGNVFFTEEVVLNAQVTRRYKLQQVEMGSYVLVIKKKREKFTQPFEVNTVGINYDDKALQQVYLPTIKLNNRILDISIPSFGNPNVAVKIYDNAGFTVFEETEKTNAYSKRLNLSKLSRGVYVVEIISYGKEVEYFTIQL